MKLWGKICLITGIVLLLTAPLLAHLSDANLIHLNLDQRTENIVKNISHIGGFAVLLTGVILLIIKKRKSSS